MKPPRRKPLRPSGVVALEVVQQLGLAHRARADQRLAPSRAGQPDRVLVRLDVDLVDGVADDAFDPDAVAEFRQKRVFDAARRLRAELDAAEQVRQFQLRRALLRVQIAAVDADIVDELAVRAASPCPGSPGRSRRSRAGRPAASTGHLAHVLHDDAFRVGVVPELPGARRAVRDGSARPADARERERSAPCRRHCASRASGPPSCRTAGWSSTVRA